MNTVDLYPARCEKKIAGDTYEKYRQRCWIWDMEPSPFEEWLAYELRMFGRTGSHVLFDKQQRIARRAIPIPSATVCPTVAKS